MYHSMSKIWRNFKSDLTRNYITRKNKSGTPCNTYSNIDQKTWNEFVKKRQNPKFQEISKKNRERQSKNLYKHTMSRGGYKGVENNLIKKKVAEMEESRRLDHSIVVEPPSRIEREIKWVEGRKNKEGKFVSSEVEVVANKISELEQQTIEGSFTPTGRQDILATAIGKPDRPGRVTGEPRDIGHKRYWGSKPRASSSKEPQADMKMDKIRAEIEAPLLQQVAELRAYIDKLTRVLAPRLDLVSDISKPSNQENSIVTECDNDISVGTLQLGAIHENNSKPTPPDLSEDGEECYLHLDDPSFRMVAKGFQFSNATSLHHREIQEDQVKVTVSKVEVGEEETSLPFPDDEVFVLGEAKGSFILWPKRLVSRTPHKAPNRSRFGNKVLHACKRQKKSPEEVAMDYLSVLHNLQPGLKFYQFSMPQCVSGRPEYKFGLDAKKDVFEFLTMQELDIGWLELSILYFIELCQTLDRKSYRFFSPRFLLRLSSNQLKNPDEEVDKFAEIELYILTHMMVNRGSCYLAPILEHTDGVGHWTIAVICPLDNTIYWFDSTYSSITNTHKQYFIGGIQQWHLRQGTPIDEIEQVTIISVKCPKQPTNVECGYYVMKFMDDIIRSDRLTTLSQFYGSKRRY